LFQWSVRFFLFILSFFLFLRCSCTCCGGQIEPDVFTKESRVDLDDDFPGAHLHHALGKCRRSVLEVHHRVHGRELERTSVDHPDELGEVGDRGLEQEVLEVVLLFGRWGVLGSLVWFG
jgi:hypothetical protein